MANHFLYYAGLDRANGIEQIGVATSSDGRVWKRPFQAPIIPLGSAGVADELQTSNPCVLYREGRYRMWYQGKSADGYLNICYAESEDGLAWTARSVPVLSPPPSASGPRAGYQQPHVLFDETRQRYRMWFTSEHAGRSWFAHAESQDGIAWDITAERLLEPTEPWEGDRLYYPFVRKTATGAWELWYTARTKGHNWTICKAESRDGKTWEKDGAPVLPTHLPGKGYKFLAELLGWFPLGGFRAAYGSGSPFLYEEDGTRMLLTHDSGPRYRLSLARYQYTDGNFHCLERGILKRGASAWDSYFQADPFLVVVP